MFGNHFFTCHAQQQRPAMKSQHSQTQPGHGTRPHPGRSQHPVLFPHPQQEAREQARLTISPGEQQRALARQQSLRELTRDHFSVVTCVLSLGGKSLATHSQLFDSGVAAGSASNSPRLQLNWTATPLDCNPTGDPVRDSLIGRGKQPSGSPISAPTHSRPRPVRSHDLFEAMTCLKGVTCA
jgi:hypothetical protein